MIAGHRALPFPLSTAARHPLRPGTMSKKFRRVASVHETMEILHRVGAIVTQTMRRYDEACLEHAVPPTTPKVKPVEKRKCARRKVAL